MRVDFRFASQVIIADDGTRMVLFPFVAYNKVENIVVGRISGNNELIDFYFPVKDQFIEDAIVIFGQSLLSKNNEPVYGTQDIDEVIIPKKPVKALMSQSIYEAPFDFTLPPLTDYIGGGGGGGNQPVAPALMPPQIPIPDIAKFLSCLNIHQSADLTIFSQKGGSGNGFGHAFISISQGSNTMTYGFYPKDPNLNQIYGAGIFGVNSGTFYDAGYSTNITPLQLQQLIILSINYQNSNYSLFTNNCADFAIDVLITIGLNTNTNGPDNPLGVFNMISPGAQFTNGNGPTTNRTCP